MLTVMVIVRHVSTDIRSASYENGDEAIMFVCPCVNIYRSKFVYSLMVKYPYFTLDRSVERSPGTIEIYEDDVDRNSPPIIVMFAIYNEHDTTNYRILMFGRCLSLLYKYNEENRFNYVNVAVPYYISTFKHDYENIQCRRIMEESYINFKLYG